MALAARRAGRRRRDGGSIAASSCASRRLSLALLLLSLVLTLCRGAADAPAGSDAAAAAPSPASCEDLLAALRANGSRDVNFATQDRGCCPPQAARAAPLGWGAPPGVAQTLRRLRHARVVLLGDSLQGQTFDALYVESVLRGVGLTRASYVCASSNHSAAAAAGAQAARGCPRDYHRMHACPKQDPDCRPVLSLAGSGLRVVYLPDVYLYGLPESYVSAGLMSQIRLEWPVYASREREGRTGASTVLPPRQLERWVEWADVAVASAGVHFDMLPVLLYTETVRYLRDVMVADRRRTAGKRHAFRATYPSHYRYGGVAPGDKPNAAAWLGEACDLGWAAPRHWTNDLAARLVGVDLPIVDAYDVMRDAGGLRSLARRNGTRFDCMHWCFEWDHLFGVVWDRIAALYA